MTEKTKADVYLTYLDQILAGEKDIGPVGDAEIARLLELAKTLITADFSANSEFRDNLRKQLLAQIAKNDKSSLTILSGNDDELDEEALDRITAAGFAEQAQAESCPYCGSRSIKIHGKCSFCGH